VDHRLVRDRYIERLSHKAAALYLFLVTVSDAQGISYYSDATLMKRLCMDGEALDGARHELIRVELVAWKKPIYQILPIEDHIPVPVVKEPMRKVSQETGKREVSQLTSIRQCLKQFAQEA